MWISDLIREIKFRDMEVEFCKVKFKLQKI